MFLFIGPIDLAGFGSPRGRRLIRVQRLIRARKSNRNEQNMQEAARGGRPHPSNPKAMGYQSRLNATSIREPRSFVLDFLCAPKRSSEDRLSDHHRREAGTTPGYNR